MARRHLTSVKTLGRRIGDVPKPDLPDHDGDGDGFITNPLTGEDDLPAPQETVEKFAKGVPEHLDRFKKAYKQNPLDGDGDCYVAAYSLVEELWRKEKDPEKRKRIRLVHGIPLGQGGDAKGQRYGHAWVEVEEEMTDYDALLESLDDERRERLKDQIADMKKLMRDPAMRTTVLDHSNGREIELPRMAYYGLGNIEPEHTRYYTYEEMIRTAGRAGHYGPWE